MSVTGERNVTRPDSALRTGEIGAWPRLMRAETASRYVDETSVQAFRRRVGTMWPLPVIGKGQRQKWDREDLDAAVARLKGHATQIFDAASVLGNAS